MPCVVDLAAMRDAIVRLGGNAERVNPLNPAELVIDHSVQVDEYGSPGALAANTAIEFARNRERYAFLRWGQKAFRNFKVVPPDTGIVHQVNLEYLARVVFTDDKPAGGAPPVGLSSVKTTRARYSRFTWWTMPVSGGTTLKLRNAFWPQRRKA